MVIGIDTHGRFIIILQHRIAINISITAVALTYCNMIFFVHPVGVNDT